MTNSFDVIVVGGGPAGSTCARLLSRAGARVAVLDAATFPRDKCCAGWITPQVPQTLGLDLDEYAKTATLQPITGFATSTLGRQPGLTSFGRVVSYAIRRCEFDHHLLNRSGATVIEGTPARRIERARGEWTIEGRFRAPLLIGAGGHFCPVGRQVNRNRRAESVVWTQEAELLLREEEAATCDVKGEVPELYFSNDRRGYGWCVRKGDFLNVGFGHLACPDFLDRVSSFKQFVVTSRKLASVAGSRWRGHAYRVYTAPTSPVVADGVMLVGDAAGLADATSGEGILRAVESGMLAARVALDCGGRYEALRLGAYSSALRRRYGDPPQGAPARWCLPAAVSSMAGRALMRSQWFSRHVLLDRWFLHQRRPALVA